MGIHRMGGSGGGAERGRLECFPIRRLLHSLLLLTSCLGTPRLPHVRALVDFDLHTFSLLLLSCEFVQLRL